LIENTKENPDNKKSKLNDMIKKRKRLLGKGNGNA
jgi:hypothetical protein